MQFQADVLGIPVEVAATALGAAALAGLAVGAWSSPDEAAGTWRSAARYEPRLPRDEADRLVEEWRLAVRRALLAE